jgi:hypothetical protein
LIAHLDVLYIWADDDRDIAPGQDCPKTRPISRYQVKMTC